MSWYYVDGGGNTQGPLTLDEMKKKFSSNQMNDGSYVWNGGDVSQWTPLKDVPQLLSQLKPQNAPPSNQGGGGGGGGNSAPARPRGRASLLSAIQNKPQLVKVDEKEKHDVSSAVNPPSGGGQGGGASQPSAPVKAAPLKLSLQEQMAATLAKRASGGGGNAAPKKVVNEVPKNEAPKNEVPKNEPPKQNPKPTPNITPSNANANKAPVKKWGAPEKEKEEPKSPANNNNNSNGDARIDSIKAKLDNAEEWQLKAIEKLLS